VIDGSDVIKRYGAKTVLNGLSLQVEAGEVCALAGRNGAGKTTFLRLVLGLARPTGGHLRVLGTVPGVAHRRINYLSEDEAVYPHLSAADNIRVAVLARGAPAPKREVIQQTLDTLALGQTGNKPARSFSLGMKRRLQLAMTSLVHEADLYILDEPTNGLDINGLLWFRSFLGDLKDRGAAVLLATHSLDELQDEVTHFAILNDGRIAAKQTIAVGEVQRGDIRIDVDTADIGNVQRVFPQATLTGNSALVPGLDPAEVYRLLAANQIVPLAVDVRRRALSQLYLEALKDE
jgi:ABC-type multidrug transport system ATPase subunit